MSESPRERLDLPEAAYWWLDLLEPGDPMWLNRPDSDEPLGRFVGWAGVSEGPRANQPVFRKGDELRVAHPHFLIPLPHGSEAFALARLGRFRESREGLVEAWTMAGWPPESP